MKLWDKLFGKKQEEMAKTQEPDDENLHHCRYFVEYKFIADLVDEVAKGELQPEVLLNIKGWKEFLENSMGEDFYFEWDEMDCQGATIDDDHLIAMYVFPKPKQVPDVAFGAVVINTKTKKAIYYTLEYTFDDSWMLCTKSKSGHSNFGEMENPSFEKFINWVVEKTNGNKA